MDDKRYNELKSKGVIDKNDMVLFKGEQVPYYYLNEDLSDFNKPRGNMPYQSDEWAFKFFKKHGLYDNLDVSSKSEVADEMFKLVETGKYKKRNLIKVLREKFPNVKAGVIHRLIKKNMDLRILEIDRTYKTKPYVIKGKYYIGGQMKFYKVNISELGYEDIWEADDEEEAKEMALIHCKQYLHEYVDDIWVEEHKEKNENNN